MEYDAFQMLLDAEREKRKTLREREIEKELAEIAMKHKRAYEAEVAPLMTELTKIEINKPPLPIRMDNGMVYEFMDPRTPRDR